MLNFMYYKEIYFNVYNIKIHFFFKFISTKDQETVSYDAGWQTRGSGRNYASLSGISFFI